MQVSKFYLGAKKYEVEYKEFDNNKLGVVYPEFSKIIIADKINNIPIKEDAQAQSLYHELIHAIFHELGYFELAKNEKLVQQMAIMVHQFETSKI